MVVENRASHVPLMGARQRCGDDVVVVGKMNGGGGGI
ncbi:uncharacterized protein G2W53_025911 [Senna tora]|uniref:Uncharacterized protein n=1 Tax=Senna tora TaxID=362788 RepID=A0A834TG50_9FABA|nr:uncharacterized protein G2W53_025911 [Senna tora]